jgi:hypothetical protein
VLKKRSAEPQSDIRTSNSSAFRWALCVLCGELSLRRSSRELNTQPPRKYLKTKSNDNFHFRFKWISVNPTCRQLDKNAA